MRISENLVASLLSLSLLVPCKYRINSNISIFWREQGGRGDRRISGRTRCLEDNESASGDEMVLINKGG